MARTTVANTIQRVRRQLNSGYRYETNFLNGAIDATTTTIVLATAPPPALKDGSIVYVDSEAMLVTAIATGNILTVKRGYFDSDGAAHSDGAEVVINPRFSPLDIMDALYEEIASYGPQLFRVVSAEISVASDTEVVELDDTWGQAFSILEVRRNWSGDDTWPRIDHRFQRGTDLWSGNTGGGPLLRLTEPMGDGTLLVVAAMPYDISTWDTTVDLVSDVGLQASMLDVVALGTKLRVWADNEYGRAARDRQDEPRRAEEVRFDPVQPMQLAQSVYVRRKQEEVNKLRAQWPVRA